MTKLMSIDYQALTEKLPYSQACENNKQPILQILKREFETTEKVLEIGSGTGQHAVFFAEQLPQLIWQTSDVIDNHPVINQWIRAHPADNLRPPIELDLRNAVSLVEDYDAVFTANTLHIISWQLAQKLITLIGQILPPKGKFCVYGPFNYDGQFTSESNRQFDAMLKSTDPESGIRDIECLVDLARAEGLSLKDDHAMPANNRLLVFTKPSEKSSH